MADIKNLNPVEIWRNFDKLTQVPRPSGHLEKIQAYLLDWAKEAGVEAFQDPAGNIVMRKPATPGMENRKGVIMQAHMDMVLRKHQTASIILKQTLSKPSSMATGYVLIIQHSVATTDLA